MDEEYEILPKDELEELRREVQKIKKNPLGDTQKSKTLLDSMESLTNSINKLVSLFESTRKELVEEYEKNNPAEAMNEILDQNEKIAKGTLAVADMIEKQQEDINSIKQELSPAKVKPIQSEDNNQNSGQQNPFGSSQGQNPFGQQNNSQQQANMSGNNSQNMNDPFGSSQGQNPFDQQNPFDSSQNSQEPNPFEQQNQQNQQNTNSKNKKMPPFPKANK